MMDRLTKLKKLRKKEKAPKKFKGTGLRIVDEDDFLSGRGSKDSDSDDQEAEDLPQIAAVLDDRPAEVKALEQFNQQNKWKTFSSISENLPAKPSGISSFSKSGESSDSDSDASLPRRKHGNSSDDTVSEENSRGSPLPSLSGPRHGKTNLSKDLSPPRRKQQDSDLSPPRRRQQGSDLSPPRRRQQGSDLSPPRRKRQDSDLSPPRRKRQDSDMSPPRKGRNSSDFSPRRNRSQELDLSPPRKKRHDSDLSPPRRKRHESDFSPPRRSRQNSDTSPPKRNRHESDLSPPRREKRSESSSSRNNNSRDSQSSSRSKRSYRDQEDRDLSPPRQKSRYDESRSLELEPVERDLSPPRRRRYDKVRRRRAAPQIIENSEQDNEVKTLGGKKAGLQKGNALKQEMDELRKKEDEMFATLDDSVTGRNAKTRIGAAKERALAEERAKKQEDEKFASERKKQYDKWGKGLKQVEDQAALVESVLHEISKPLARSKDDEDLDAHLRSIDRDGDPMLKFLTKKKGKGSDKPKYNGPAPPPNRFHIPPGYRWDGVDRSNGYEKQWFGRINARKALQEESYKWSVEDL